MNNYTFANPDFFYLLLLILPMTVWYILKNNKTTASIQFSSLTPFEKAPRTYKYYLRHILFVFRIVVIALLVTVLARPQSVSSWQDETTEGIDIMLAIDLSGSMLAEDFKPNRLEASKDVAIQFIAGRPLDRIGLVVFSAESFTQCPLTTDHAVLMNLFSDLKSGLLQDGTAIGLGLANAVARLKDSDAKSRVVILLTDGVNNSGDIDPYTAADIAETFGIRVYTVGVGTQGVAPYPVPTPFGVQYQNMPVEIDEVMLRKVAEQTNGKYFRATNKQKLLDIYKEIDNLEKSKIDVKQYNTKNEEYLKFALWAGFFLLLEILFRNTIFRHIP